MPGHLQKRTCLTSRAAKRPSTLVRIRDNTFNVGHMQEAVLVTDARDIDVSGNRIAVKPRKTARLPIEKFLGDKTWLAKIVAGLVARPVLSKLQTKNTDKFMRAKQWRIGFQSPLRQEVWDEMVKANPPSNNDLANKENFEKYGNRIIALGAK